ncbi:hypothetical protein [Sphingomonas turrisvirgatae]|uniref:LexA repressor DNA-binding domain-containing protein n=1 Tax=Sphingomonas turrisvirgatae TaxID=1888892 RepID=A0A1E3LZX1_9SPHN|nr:hypothetical protein [Sphingomonas turrisvirgatae]ODP39268.1 hypothetical protein BFL28_10670 [Sphingomonas turrisvirgatae]
MARAELHSGPPLGLLSDNEAIIYRALDQAAREGRPCPANEELSALLGCSSDSTSPTIVTRLDRRGYIRVQRYQRSRQVTIIRTGMSTAEPASKAPHWRDRPKNIPAPAPDSIKAKRPDTFSQIVMAANRERRPIADFLADLVWIGFDAFKQEEAQS